MERLIDPMIADLQCEHADAMRHGRVLRARWVRIASGIAFCKVVTVALFAPSRHGTRALAVALSAATLVTTMAICSVLAGTPATIHTRGRMVLLVLYLVPQALTISVPVCLALGLFIWIRREGADLPTRRTVLWLMRLSLLLAVLEKRAGLSLAGDDVYVNIAGGMSIEEPAADLSVVAAVASSVRNRGLSPSTAVFGEVGLSGEIRGIPQAPLRIREAVQMGFTRVVLPAANMDPSESSAPADKADCELIGVRTLGEALDELMA
jgi:hypothetical protein